MDQKGVSPLPSKIQAVSKMTPPANIKDVQCFLGMLGYYQRFIPSFADVTQPLFNLLKKDIEFSWSTECQDCFIVLKKLFCNCTSVALSSFFKPFVLYTDASLVAVGSVLFQLDKKGLDNPIAYFSRTLNVHEQNYTVTERECQVVLYGIQECRPYIYGSHFTVVTDHSSLKWLMNIKDPDGRLSR